MVALNQLTEIAAQQLAAAFPSSLRQEGLTAAADIAWCLRLDQRGEPFEVRVGAEPVAIPYRLYFASERCTLAPGSVPWLMSRALRSRSDDGFERQRATLDLLSQPVPWCAPFLVALIGEYVVEILSDIDAGLTPDLADMLATFIRANPDYWAITKQRVGSYWNAYYRSPRSRSTYVGFRLIEKLEAALPPV